MLLASNVVQSACQLMFILPVCIIDLASHQDIVNVAVILHGPGKLKLQFQCTWNVRSCFRVSFSLYSNVISDGGAESLAAVLPQLTSLSDVE